MFHIAKDTKLAENSVIACSIFLFISLVFVIITFYVIKICICNAGKKESVLEDGMNSAPKYCMEESPPTYEEAIKMETIL